ncbi:hypothetical protein [Chryseobacterium cheonjiense]|uniref:Uncharacterized protein n=1 Tax=Chryseobacterium cheonjiense TaxID=2728845 RepID=A0A7Y0FH40_9FLAO|nr:hypothetical protein [Chryseobacterium cheonjiense]NML55855.1 hypothetical protein [Chryseobacterium cheonjiense]
MLKEINEQLLDLGYKSFIRTVGNEEKIFSSVTESLGPIFWIFLKNNKINIDYTVGQIPVEKEFKTIEELLKFVRQVFPIEE